jgi:hypothetical protein
VADAYGITATTVTMLRESQNHAFRLWATYSVTTGRITPHVDLYFRAPDCTTPPPADADSYTIVVDKSAAPGWLVGNFDKAWAVDPFDTYPTTGLSDFVAHSVRRGDTGVCEGILQYVRGHRALSAYRYNYPSGGFAYIPFGYPILYSKHYVGAR